MYAIDYTLISIIMAMRKCDNQGKIKYFPNVWGYMMESA